MSALAGFASRHLFTSPWTEASNSHRTHKSCQMAATFGHDRPELDLKGWPGGERLYQEATSVQMHIKLERFQRDNVKTQIKFRQDFWLSCMNNSCIIFTLNDYDRKYTLMGSGSDLKPKLEVWVWRRTVLVLSPPSVPHVKQTCTYTQHHCFLTFTISDIFSLPELLEKTAVGLKRVLGHYLIPSFAGFTGLCPSLPTCVSPADDPQNKL